MADGRDDGPLDANLRRLLPRVRERQAPDPAFRERLGRLIAAAPRTPARPVRRHILAASLAFAAAALVVWGIGRSRSGLPSMPPVSQTLSAADAVQLRAPDGRRSAVAFAPAGGASLFRVELRDGASLSYLPGAPARLQLRGGFLRLETTVPLRLRAADTELAVAAGTDLLVELAGKPKGDTPMRPIWLIPPSAAAGAGLTLAVLVAQGRVELPGRAHGKPEVPAPGSMVVLEAHEAGGPSQRKVDELERKVAALRQENGRLSGQLAQKKGVTVASVLERITAMKRSPLPGMLTPGALTELETDLKGLGAAGIAAMTELLKSSDPKERFLAAKILEDMSAPESIPALRDAAINDTDRMAASMASHALALMDDAATVPALRAIVEANKSWEGRVNALWGLCKHGDERGLAQALAMVKNEAEPAQARAALGANLMLLSDPELLPIVDETLRAFGSAPQVASLAVNYYKSLGTPEGRQRLEAMAADAKLDEAARQAARDALAKP